MTNTYGTKRRRFTRKQIIVASAAGAVLLAPAAAFAAVQIFGFGDFTGTAAANGTLQVVNGTAGLTKTLAPGQTVGVKGNVKNPNDYPIKVTDLYVKNSSVAISGGSATECKITLNGGTAAAFPKPEGGFEAAGTATKFTLPTAVEIPAGFTVQVTVPNVIKQDDSATKMCGVSASYAVGGIVGS